MVPIHPPPSFAAPYPESRPLNRLFMFVSFEINYESLKVMLLVQKSITQLQGFVILFTGTKYKRRLSKGK